MIYHRTLELRVQLELMFDVSTSIQVSSLDNYSRNFHDRQAIPRFGGLEQEKCRSRERPWKDAVL